MDDYKQSVVCDVMDKSVPLLNVGRDLSFIRGLGLF